MRPGKCPFYGFRWPERKTDLIEVGGNECALDFDNQGPCKMASHGYEADFSCCDTALKARFFLAAIADRIRFIPRGAQGPVPFSEWSEQMMREVHPASSGFSPTAR